TTRYQAAAASIATSTAATAASLLQLARPPIHWNLSNLMTTEVAAFLKELAGYSDLFASQDFCACEHCGSILGPAAYFVDVMRFIDTKITQPHFAAKPNHPLKLSNRRPDL